MLKFVMPVLLMLMNVQVIHLSLSVKGDIPI